MTDLATGQSLLEPIEATLRRLVGRCRAAIVLRGAMATLLAAAAGIFLAMGIGWRWPVLEDWQHYALTLMWVSAAAVTAVLTLIRPLAHSFTLAGMARVVEQRHPELHERLSSAIELLSSRDSAEMRGSQALIFELARQASGDARQVQPRQEVTFGRARPYLIGVGGAAVVMALLLTFWPTVVGRLLAKTVAPYMDLPNIYANELTITPGQDMILPDGSSLQINVRVDNPRVNKVQFCLAQAAGSDRPSEMDRLPDGQFEYRLSDLGENLRYRIRAGDARSQYFAVTIVPRPAVKAVQVSYGYPAYMGQAASAPTDAEGKIAGPTGATATVRLQLNTPVKSAGLTISGAAAPMQQLDETTCQFTYALAKPGAGSWHVQLTDVHGFTGASREYPIEIRPDTPPAVRIAKPTEDKIKLNPADRLPIQYELTDDFGLSAAQLLVNVDGRALSPVAIPVSAAAARRGGAEVDGVAMLDLSALNMPASARRVNWQIRALDNRPDIAGGPQEGVSPLRTIELDVKAVDYIVQVQMALDLRVRDALQRVFKELQAGRAISEPLRRSMPATTQLSQETLGKVDELRKHLAAAEDDARKVAEATSGSMYPKLSETMTRLADNQIGKAAELAGAVKLTDSQPQRADQAEQADYHVDRAMQIVSELLKEFDVMTDLARRAAELDELAQREKDQAAKAALAAAQPTTTAPADAAAKAAAEQAAKAWEKAQQEIARDTANVVKATPGATKEALADDTKQAQDLAALAEQIQKSQQALIENTTAAQKVAELTAQQKALAAEQAQLAAKAQQLNQRAAAITPASAPADAAVKSTTQAAAALATTQPASAVPAQATAADAMDKIARAAQAETARDAAAKLADAAEKLAQQQSDLAKQSDQARAAQDAADQAAAAAKTAQAEAAKLAAPVAQKTNPLAAKQDELARRAAKLEEAAKPSDAAKPADAMKQSAQQLKAGDPVAAAPNAAQAADKAGKLAKELGQRADAADKAAEQAAQQHSPEKVQQAENSARSAESAAKAADDQAKQAQQQADASGAEADKQAAQSAKAAAKQAADKAASARAAADAAAKAPAAAKATADQAAAQADQAKKLAQEQGDLAKATADAAKADAPAVAAAKQAAEKAAAAQAQAKQAADKAAGQNKVIAAAQKQLTPQANQLKQLAQQATPEAQAAMKQNDPSAAMSQAENQLDKNQPAQAGQSQQTAAQQLKQLAQAAAPKSKPVSPAVANEVAQSAGKLAAEQRDLQKRTADMAAQLAAAQSQQENAEARRLAAEQNKLAKQAAELADAVGEQAPQPDRAQQKAARAAADAAEQAAAGKLDQAAHSGQQAADTMKDLAGRLNAAAQAEPAAQEPQQVAAEQGPTPAQKKADLADKAADLTKKQQRLAGEMAALAAKETPRLLASKQDAIAESTQELKQGAELVDEHVDQLLNDPAAKQLAQEVSAAIKQAAAAQEQAQKSMTSAPPGQSLPNQQASAQSLGQAAKSLRALGQKLAEQAAKASPAPPDAKDAADQLANALEQTDKAAQSKSASDTAKAAGMLAALAKQAAQDAQSKGAMQPSPADGQPKNTPAMTSNARAGHASPDLTPGELKELGISAADWAKLPGELRDQVLQASHASGPEEYRGLVKRYFQAVAKKAAASSDK